MNKQSSGSFPATLACRFAVPSPEGGDGELLCLAADGGATARLPCGGRVDAGMILAAVERGASPVIVATCGEDACRHGEGSRSAAREVGKAEALLRLLGYPEGTVRLEGGEGGGRRSAASPDPARSSAGSPAAEVPRGASPADSLPGALRKSGALACLDCGKCTAVCPVARHAEFSPRLTVALLQAGDDDVDPGVWDCLTCGRCEVDCPSNVKFVELVERLRRTAAAEGTLEVPCTHGGVLHSLMRLASSPPGRPRRLDWVPKEARIAERGKILYFTGCLPLFDRVFADLGADPLSIARSTLRVLNALELSPVLLAGERCCGHDLLGTGDEAGFLALARENLEEIRRSGASTVVFSCAECFRTFRHDILPRFGPQGFTALHLSEFLEGRMSSLPLKPGARRVTWHDPCRLGRMEGVLEAPRKVLGAVPGLSTAEMERHGAKAACCGTSLWAACGQVSRALQAERLEEAARTGAEALVTACPKCRLHFACARASEGGGELPGLRVMDLAELVAEALDPAAARK